MVGQVGSAAAGAVREAWKDSTVYLSCVLFRNHVKYSASHCVNSMVRLEVTPPTWPVPPTVVAPAAGWTFVVAGPRPITRTLVKMVLVMILGGPAGGVELVLNTEMFAEAMTVK